MLGAGARGLHRLSGAGRALLKSRLALCAYALFPVLLTFVPVLSALATIDQMVMLGGSLVMLGLVRFGQGERHWRIATIAGLALTSIKLNSWILAGVFVVLYGALLWRTRRPSARDLALLAMCAGVCSLPYVWLTLEWGSPAPMTPAQIALLTSGSPAQAGHKGIVEYIVFALQSFAGFMNFSALHWMYDAIYLALLAALVWRLANAGAVARQATPLGAAMTAAAGAWLITFALHLAYSYRNHLAYDWPHDFYGRYYLSALPGLGLLYAQSCADALQRVARFYREGRTAMGVLARLAV